MFRVFPRDAGIVVSSDLKTNSKCNIDLKIYRAQFVEPALAF
jgi:hypothetical protein